MRNLQFAAGSLFANRFELERPAGSGGMGTVYRARDRYSGKVVALKLLHSPTGTADEAERFAREAHILSEQSHPGIVAHVAHGQTPDGQRFLTMEWREEEDLGQRLLRGPLPLRDCLRLLGQVAEALCLAHQRGIIHRDASRRPRSGRAGRCYWEKNGTSTSAGPYLVGRHPAWGASPSWPICMGNLPRASTKRKRELCW